MLGLVRVLEHRPLACPVPAAVACSRLSASEVGKRLGLIDGPLLQRRASRRLRHVAGLDADVFQLLAKPRSQHGHRSTRISQKVSSVPRRMP